MGENFSGHPAADHDPETKRTAANYPDEAVSTCFNALRSTEHHRGGSTHAPETQMRTPLQSVSLLHPVWAGAVLGT